MTNTERQLITDLVEKAQAVIDSVDSSDIVTGVNKDTTYEVNANAVWDLGTAISVVEYQLRIGQKESDR